MQPTSSRLALLAFPLLLFVTCAWHCTAGEAEGPVSKRIAEVLRESLPPEELRLDKAESEWIIKGPTFEYRVEPRTGALRLASVALEGNTLISSDRPLEILMDDSRLELAPPIALAVVDQEIGKIIISAQGVLRASARMGQDVDCTLLHTFYNDGVVVATVKLKPRKDLQIRKAITLRQQAKGAFTHYLHKRRDEHGGEAARGCLPQPGANVRFSTLTSCLQVFGSGAALALFTDSGCVHRSNESLDSASVEVTGDRDGMRHVVLSQFIVHVAEGGDPYILNGGKEFTFRAGLSVAPSRLPHRRMHDLRMFAWVGDAEYPYATDEEIEKVARAGYTVFQMHRLGNPGEPRPPEGQLERLIKKVHETGMLFLWTENADLMYDSAPGVRDLKRKGQWPLWQGFNYGGSYKASMDPYCDLTATCLASPNGLADYRIATLRRMMERFEVDGVYLDDNLAYPDCTLGREHGHPHPIYDCLIELHDMNWRRRELLRARRPYQVLVAHTTKALVLPVICNFDAILYGEGYSFGSLENYWDYYRPVNAIPAQGMIWPGGQDPQRCAASVAYNFDLLTGGGQYCQIDWRLFPEKFPHGAGVVSTEYLYVQTYNLAQYYFGLHESKAWFFRQPAAQDGKAPPFSTTTPLTYAAVYHNPVWNDWMIPVANMAAQIRQTSLKLSPTAVGMRAEADCVLLDLHNRNARHLKTEGVEGALQNISIPPESLQLFALRQLPPHGATHIWGGKRLLETWDAAKNNLNLVLDGPAGVKETVLLASRDKPIREVYVNGKKNLFFFDSKQNMVHGSVTFGAEPLRIEVRCSAEPTPPLPQQPLEPSPLGRLLNTAAKVTR